MRTSWGSATDRGRVRELNEDALLAHPPVFLVADGMGGHSAGDLASRLAVQEFSRLTGRTTTTADEVHECFGRVAARLRRALGASRSAGTTVAGVALAVHDGAAYWLVFNIGDSRVYRLADARLEQVSVDHSLVQELVDSGEITPAEARRHPRRNVVTRAVGTGPAPEPDYWLIPAAAADRVLVCSDGLTSELADEALHDVLQSVVDPQDAAHALVAAAVVAGGRDNVSAVVVDVASLGEESTDVTVPQPDARPALVPTPTAPEADPWDDAVDGATVPRPLRPVLPEVPS